MICADIARLSAPYLSGELDAAQTAEFEQHLEACPACAGEIAGQRELDARLRHAVLSEDAPAGDFEPLRRRIEDQILAEQALPPRRAFPKGARLWTVAAAAAACVLAGGFYYWGARPAQAPGQVVLAAAADHRREVVEQQRRIWASGDAAIESLGRTQAVPARALPALASSGYELKQGKLCLLHGKVFLHLVYSRGGHQISVFLRGQGGEPLSGRRVATVNGRRLYASEVDREQVACFTGSALTAIFIGDRADETALLARLTAAAL